MIHGVLHKWKTEKGHFPSAFSTALAFVDNNDVLKMAPGRYDIVGDNVFAMVRDITTEPAQMRRFELHHKYIDIQLIISGREQQLYALAPDFAPITDTLAADDIAFYAHPLKYNSVILESGDYSVYFPNELHCPSCSIEAAQSVRKIVFKIKNII